MALTDKLTAIADGFRASRGTEDKYTLDQMAVLAAEPTGGSGDITDEELTLTDNCQYMFYMGRFLWLIEKFGDRITTKDINNLTYMFYYCPDIEEIPFQLNVTDCTMVTNAFSYSNLKVCPKIRGTLDYNTSLQFTDVCTSSYHLRDIEDLFLPEMLDGFATFKVTSQYSSVKPIKLTSMYSLRKAPSWLDKFVLCPESTAYPNATNTLYNNLINYCYSLDELVNLPVWKCTATKTDNMFSSIASRASRLKNFTFETNEDGTPIVTEWKNQAIDLTTQVGYASALSVITAHNSGITTDKEVKDDTTYQALKDDPDWFTCDLAYSRYNHDSAVATINSLPDCSATGTNTIKFKGTAGSSTDGGAINTLTEEEIAVATAKGWTVTLS